MPAPPASVWLQLAGEAGEALRRTIADLAALHGTVPFEPHLTVCRFPQGDAKIAAAASSYVTRSGLLPLRVMRAAISHSTAQPFRAVVIDIADHPQLQEFREALRKIAVAPRLEPAHISLLYTIDKRQNLVEWAFDEARLHAIAQDCAATVAAMEFELVRPVVVAPQGEWTNIQSWQIVQKLS